MSERVPKGRNVKSEPRESAAGATDGHERAKDFMTAAELAALLEAAKSGRHGTRDHLLLMMMFRHGLRVSEAVSLRLDELDLDRSMLDHGKDSCVILTHRRRAADPRCQTVAGPCRAVH